MTGPESPAPTRPLEQLVNDYGWKCAERALGTASHEESREAYLRLMAGIAADCRDLRDALRDGLNFSSGWREAIVELEDFCREPVRLKNMLAAADQIDDWAQRARAVLDRLPK